MLKALHPSPIGFFHLPFLELVRSPSTVMMLLAGEHPREALGCRTLFSGLIDVEEMDFVQT